MSNFLDERLPQRFWDKCIPEPMSGCWLRIAAVNNTDYGIIGGFEHTRFAAFRVYDLTFRQQIDERLEQHKECAALLEAAARVEEGSYP